MELSWRSARWSWGLSVNPSPTGVGAGRPVLSDLVLSIPSEFGGVQLVRQWRQRADGRGPADRSPGRRRPLPLPAVTNIQRAVVTSVSQATGDDGALSHQVGIRFRGVKATFTRQNPDGSAGPALQVDIGIV